MTVVDHADSRMLPYTIERLGFVGGGVAHFAVTVDDEVAAIAADAAPHWPLVARGLARTVVCNTRGVALTLTASRGVPDCQLCVRFVERLEAQIEHVRGVRRGNTAPR